MENSLPDGINELSVANQSTVAEPTECQLVHESDTTRIFRSGDHGTKVLFDPNLSTDKRRALLRLERNVSISLSSSCLQRKVLRVDFSQDIPRMHFEWVDGVSVDQWLRPDADANKKLCAETHSTDMTLTTRLEVALAVTKAVCDFHESGVFHGNLTLKNIILKFREESLVCSATLIDYSKSVILSDCLYTIRDENERREYLAKANQKELNDLGLIIYAIMNNTRHPEQHDDKVNLENNGKEHKNKREKSQWLDSTSNLPVYLMSLISSLLTEVANYGGNGTIQYKHPREVLLDLQLACEKPDTYLKVHRWSDLVSKSLVIPQGSFYGRRAEVSMLQHSFDVMMEGKSNPCALIVSGYAGAGKTTFFTQITTTVRQSNGYMVVCKFNESDPPDTILASGFDSFFGYALSNSNDESRKSLKTRIEEALGDHVDALEESMPHLRKLLRRKEVIGTGARDTPALKLRWKFLLSNLVYAICSQSHPMVLLFEDLHWATDDALDTIKLIMLDSKIRYCLFGMSYRDTDVQSKLIETIKELENAEVLIWRVTLGPIEKESIDTLVSETLCMPPTTVKPLSDAIYKKTGGMILFAINLLKTLHDARLVTFNLTTLRWEFDLDRIIETDVSSDIVKFLSDQISCLPTPIQAGLRIASCLGSSFNSSVFQRASKSSDDETGSFISFVVEHGYLQELSPDQFTWSHDQVYQAAYSLTPPDMRDSTHLLVGTRIYLSAKNDEIYGLIHEIARNMNFGIHLLESQEQRIDLAELNLLAGEQSMKTSAFYTASKYFLAGIELLEEDWQHRNYDLGMQLFISATQMLLITGDTKRFERTIETPLTHARNFEDRLPAHHNHVRYLLSSGRFKDALHLCFSVLSEFGENFPDEVTPEIIQEEVASTESLLNNYPVANLNTLQQLTDPLKLSLMETMTITLLNLYSIKADYVPLVACRMVQRSITYGWSPHSMFGLFSFGYALICESRIDAGHCWVKTALSLAKQFNRKDHVVVLETLYHVRISFWVEPLQATCQALNDMHSDALLEGQIEFAMAGSLQSFRRSLFCGNELTKVSNDAKLIGKEMAKLKQKWSILHLACHQYSILKLMGQSDVNEAFSFLENDISNEEDLLENAISLGDDVLIQCVYFFRMFTSFWFKNYKIASQNAEIYGKSEAFHMMDVYHCFYSGLIGFRLARSNGTDRDKWMDIGRTAVTTFESWKSHSLWNFESKYLLLLAELEFLEGDCCGAEEHYKASIVSAQKHKFIHEEGLAMELLGSLYMAAGNKEGSIEMLLKARGCYEKWGATAVVEVLDAQIPKI